MISLLSSALYAGEREKSGGRGELCHQTTSKADDDDDEKGMTPNGGEKEEGILILLPKIGRNVLWKRRRRSP